MRTNQLHISFKLITASTLTLSLLPILFFSQAYAMENSDYVLDLESPSFVKSRQTTKTPTTITAKQVQGPGYKAILSFDSEKKIDPFFTKNSTNILNFGEIKPGEALLRTNILEIIPGSAPGFQVSAYTDHTLRADSKAEIPHTSCDNGNCTSVLPDTWTLPLTYGYGFRCDNVKGDSCEMNIKDTFKRFANQESKESPTIVLYSFRKGDSKVEFSHKINIPGNQQLTGYRNTVILISAPLL